MKDSAAVFHEDPFHERQKERKQTTLSFSGKYINKKKDKRTFSASGQHLLQKTIKHINGSRE